MGQGFNHTFCQIVISICIRSFILFGNSLLIFMSFPKTLQVLLVFLCRYPFLLYYVHSSKVYKKLQKFETKNDFQSFKFLKKVVRGSFKTTIWIFIGVLPLTSCVSLIYTNHYRFCG